MLFQNFGRRELEDEKDSDRDEDDVIEESHDGHEIRDQVDRRQGVSSNGECQGLRVPRHSRVARQLAQNLSFAPDLRGPARQSRRGSIQQAVRHANTSLRRRLIKVTPEPSSVSRFRAVCPVKNYFANGLGRICMWRTSGLLPLPPSWCQGVRSPSGIHRPRPFQPALGSSMRPSKPLVKKPSG
jgi:hypothetical protein